MRKQFSASIAQVTCIHIWRRFLLSLIKWLLDVPILDENRKVSLNNPHFKKGVTYKDMSTGPNHIFRCKIGKIPFLGLRLKISMSTRFLITLIYLDHSSMTIQCYSTLSEVRNFWSIHFLQIHILTCPYFFQICLVYQKFETFRALVK